MLAMIRRALETRNGRSWVPAWVFLIAVAAFFAHRAAVENDSAGRQRTSFGVISGCQEHGRGHIEYCSYSFAVGDEHYSGRSKAEEQFYFGSRVTVYFE